MEISRNIELLSPAKNISIAKSAILHGADAVYIGAQNFSARKNASNSLEEIEELCDYAHFYFVKVFVAVNTILFDNELLECEKLLWQLYRAGVDAIIIQDLGILTLKLPPIEFHASTQCNIRTKERAQFIDSLGFNQMVLARELSLEQIKNISDASTSRIEFFIHGALCVCYSGQCYMSAYATGRSGNRGECAQLCRHAYTVTDAQGAIISTDSFLLSLKDLNVSEDIADLINAGVYSLKIEGRLKDENYVKNITAYYHKLLENTKKTISFKRTSSGTVELFFEPDTERSFNRLHTNYFLKGRNKNLTNPLTPKSIGKYIGTISQINGKKILLQTEQVISNGDGLCFVTNKTILFSSVNGKDGNWVELKDKLPLNKDTKVYRNKDIAFEKILKGKTASRKIEISMNFSQRENKALLTIVDEDSIEISHEISIQNEVAKDKDKLQLTLEQQLHKTGEFFFCKKIDYKTPLSLFMTVGEINALRRETLQLLIEKRKSYFLTKRKTIRPISKTEIQKENVIFNENISNKQASSIYRDFGSIQTINAVEVTQNFKNIELMRTKYCIKYELGMCSTLQGYSKQISQPLYLTDNKNRYALYFDCEKCEMIIKTK